MLTPSRLKPTRSYRRQHPARIYPPERVHDGTAVIGVHAAQQPYQRVRIIGQWGRRGFRGLGNPGLRDGITDPVLKLGCDLYVLAQFEPSDNATFLTLCTALEVLAPQNDRPGSVLALVDQWVEEARERECKALPDSEEFRSLQSLAGGLKSC